MEKTAKKRIVDVLILLLILLLSVGAASLVLYATRWGPWAFSDSAAYLSCARNYSAGLGLSMTRADGIITPLTLFPPGYAFLLSRVSVWVGSDLLAARVIDALCFGLVVFIVAAGLLVLTQDRLLAVASAALVVASPVMLVNFTGLMSEPCSCSCSAVLLFHADRHPRNKKTVTLFPRCSSPRWPGWCAMLA